MVVVVIIIPRIELRKNKNKKIGPRETVQAREMMDGCESLALHV